MAHQTTPRSYRCSYHPKDSFGHAVLSESGVLPSIQLKARSASQAEALAWATVGCPVASVERLEDAEMAT